MCESWALLCPPEILAATHARGLDLALCVVSRGGSLCGGGRQGKEGGGELQQYIRDMGEEFGGSES